MILSENQCFSYIKRSKYNFLYFKLFSKEFKNGEFPIFFLHCYNLLSY